MPPAGTRRPQTPAATGPTMMKDGKLIAAVVQCCIYGSEGRVEKICQLSKCRTKGLSAEIVEGERARKKFKKSGTKSSKKREAATR
jgi:hypothetical protein